jgi:large subunit ribosomal protein L7/L12
MAEEKEKKEAVPAEETKEKPAPVSPAIETSPKPADVPKATPKPQAKKEPEVKIPEKFKKLVEEIEKMSVLDLAELVKILEKKFGVSAAAPMVAAAPGAPAAGTAGAPVEEKSVFNIELKAVGDKKIEVIKVVRDIAGKGLKEAKDLVDAAASGPQMVKENVKKEEAEEIKKKFEAAGAKVELK